ncbi:MAG: succinic semialdehyde dehydrogenase [Actinomycetota bacterium]|nr:succinic semialdehyde dehydrogenase [Actinomycetota bacterium]
MTAQPGRPPVTGPADPEHDPSATYALDPALARRLTSRVLSTTGETSTTTAPFTGQPVASVPRSGVEDVATAFERAREAQQRWARVPLALRAEALLRLHDLVLDRQQQVMDLIQWESGKARKHAFEETAHVAMTARYYARTARRHLDTSRRLGVYPVLTRVDVNRLPKGVVGIISPWNYPFTLALSDGLPAVLAGNAVVHKPDSQTPLTALLGVELLEEAGLPPDLWQTVYGPGSVVGSAIIDHADYVCFTGSTATGRRVAARAAERLIGCSLELGGKNPMLVLRDADLDRAAEGAVRGCFSSAGQLCVSMERLYVAEEVYERFLAKFLRRVEAMRLSTSLDFTGDMGSLISRDQLDTVSAHVDDARAKGARVLAGGRARPDVGPLFYEPTVLEGVDPSMRCYADETFGPVVSLYRFREEADAVARANEGCYGLNASVYTRDGRRGRALASRLQAGTVNVNEPFGASFASVDSPMGGVRDSGLGRRQGAEGVHRYTEAQTVATQRGLPIAPSMGMGDKTFARVLTGALRVLRKTGRP